MPALHHRSASLLEIEVLRTEVSPGFPLSSGNTHNMRSADSAPIIHSWCSGEPSVASGMAGGTPTRPSVTGSGNPMTASAGAICSRESQGCLYSATCRPRISGMHRDNGSRGLDVSTKVHPEEALQRIDFFLPRGESWRTASPASAPWRTGNAGFRRKSSKTDGSSPAILSSCHLIALPRQSPVDSY